ISRQLRQPLVVTIAPAVDDRDGLALDITALAEATMKSAQPISRCLCCSVIEEADHRHHHLLRACRQRPRRRAAEQRDELAAPHHSITSSARASSMGGMSTPSVLAVCKLMTNSNLVGS